jgi:uracil phosphoribosyltransferase
MNYLRTLLDHGAKEEKILLITVIAATYGVVQVHRLFPRVTVICAAIDTELNDQGYILPGMLLYSILTK